MDATGVNNSGQVVGDGPLLAELVTPSSTAVVPCKTSARSVEDTVTPMVSTTADRSWGYIMAITHAFLYSGGSMQDLGTLGGT